MTVKELKNRLAAFPEELSVVLGGGLFASRLDDVGTCFFDGIAEGDVVPDDEAGEADELVILLHPSGPSMEPHAEIMCSEERVPAEGILYLTDQQAAVYDGPAVVMRDGAVIDPADARAGDFVVVEYGGPKNG